MSTAVMRDPDKTLRIMSLNKFKIDIQVGEVMSQGKRRDKTHFQFNGSYHLSLRFPARFCNSLFIHAISFSFRF